MSLNLIKKVFLLAFFQCFGTGLQIGNNFDIAPEIIEITTCPIFTCKPENVSFTEDTCALWDEASNSYFCSPCSDSSKICMSSLKQNSTCNLPIPPDRTGQSYPGEKCYSSDDCDPGATLSCTKGVCKGLSAGKKCSISFSCNPGFMCNSNKCQPQTKAGSKGCLQDYDCENGAGCNVTDSLNFNANWCIKYGTVRPHEIITGCIDNFSLLCQYAYCATYKNSFACTNQLKSTGSIPLACTTKGASCTSISDDFFDPPFSIISQNSCECAFTATGNDLYCNLFYGDDPYMTYYNKLLEWLHSSDVKKCNTGRRTDSWCIYSNWNKKDYDALSYYQVSVYYYPFIQKTEQCVLSSFFEEGYWMYRENYNKDDDNDDSSAAVLVFSMLIIELI